MMTLWERDPLVWVTPSLTASRWPAICCLPGWTFRCGGAGWLTDSGHVFSLSVPSRTGVPLSLLGPARCSDCSRGSIPRPPWQWHIWSHSLWGPLPSPAENGLQVPVRCPPAGGSPCRGDDSASALFWLSRNLLVTLTVTKGSLLVKSYNLLFETQGQVHFGICRFLELSP